jgi:formate dehydrogenase subunit gamma
MSSSPPRPKRDRARRPSPPPARPPTPMEQAIDRAVAAHKDDLGPLLPVLHAIHDEHGYLPPETVERVADGLNLSRAEVHGVITFYHDFRTRPPGRHVLKVCRAEACQAMGSEALAATLQARLGVRFKETSADGAVTLEPVYCLGNCALSPAVMLDGELRGRVTQARLDALLAELVRNP